MKIIGLLLAFVAVCPLGLRADLAAGLQRYADGYDARIGIAVIIDGRDTIVVNGGERFPMMSVYKFPQALAVAGFCGRTGMTISDSVRIAAGEIKENTWSPLREIYGTRDLCLPLDELLEFTLRQSDNNACDVLFRLLGGPQVADSLMKATGYGDIDIVSTEDAMHRDPGLCLRNCSTPLAMARLFDEFNVALRYESPLHGYIARMLESCLTGTDRLVGPLAGTAAVVGHKTGTGDTDGRGRIIAVNDAGYVNLPDGRRYAIAVFVADSAYDMARTSEIIAEISAIVFDAVSRRR